MVVTGHKGVAKVGHHRAAEFVRWSLTLMETEAMGEPTASSVVGAISYIDAFWASCSQYSVGLYMGKSNSGEESWWVWDNVRVVMSQGTVSMVVVGKPSIRAVF